MRFVFFLSLVPVAFGQLFSAGIKIGAPLTESFADATYSNVAGGLSVRSFSDSKKFVIGPMVELHLPFGFSVNADGLYRPLHLTVLNAVPGSGSGIQTGSYASWEVTPALRYRFLHTPIVKPFAEAGPSFRFLAAPLDHYLSGNGFTVGAGVEVKLLRLRVTPELRVTRWGSDHNASITFPVQSGQNQAEFLAGFSF